MSKIVYKKGDVTSADEVVIVHGCNAQGVMGSGVAAAIRRKYPLAYQTYKNISDNEGLNLGTIVWEREHGKLIGNMITQQSFGGPGVRWVSYIAVGACFRRLNKFMQSSQGRYGHTVALPKIGAGLGGGDWSLIAGIIEEEATAFTPVVYELE